MNRSQFQAKFAMSTAAMVLIQVVSTFGGLAGSAVAAEAAKKPAKSAVKKVTASRLEVKSQANQMAAGIAAADVALTPEEVAIAQRVEVGNVACELGVTVNVKADPLVPGYFDLEGKNFKFRMKPVVTSTGAIRLQDGNGGAVWLQLANKSMLMSQKLGSRLADACLNPSQAAVAQAMEKAPPVGLFDSAQSANQTKTPAPSSATATVGVQ